MTGKLEAVLNILRRGDKVRDLYKGNDGKYWVTYSADDRYEPLTGYDISELLQAGAIRRKWKDCDGCFILTTPNAELRGRPLADGPA